MKEVISGIKLAAASAGIKKSGQADLVLIEIAPDSEVVGVFTQNAFCAAPVTVARTHLEKISARYLLINSGNANAGTGERGLSDADKCCEFVADSSACTAQQVLPFSTGVIGEYLPTDKVKEALPTLFAQLAENNWLTAAKGIMTTDTRPKLISKQIQIDGKTVTVTGIAKGAGMIRPNMATLLAYVATDAIVEKSLLQSCLNEVTKQSFNRITVDGDTSTNDACILIATGKSGIDIIREQQSTAYVSLNNAIEEVCVELAKELVRDGEGATKLVTVNVTGGKSQNECEEVAYTVAHSPLTKTAMFASDPNWGRVLAAVGRSKVDGLDANAVSIAMDDQIIAVNGERSKEYDELSVQAVMDKSEYNINIDLGRGNCSAHVWTCDFSYDYVKINAEYRT